MGIEFVYSQPVKIFFGQGQFARIAEVISQLGLHRCIIVCGRHFSSRAKLMEERMSEICGVFDGVRENPQLSGIIETAALARLKEADGIIGVGGGSAIDTAKFASMLVRAPGETLSYFKGDIPFPAEHLPVIAVPTTAGTGSEVTQVSVVSHGKEKKTFNTPAFMPLAAVVDPELSASVPGRTTINTGLDAMAHALEGYWSRNHQPISDIMAIEAVRLALENLERAYLDGSDMQARSGMALAALMGGLAFALPKTAACHACSYPLSEDYGLPHGEACAFTLDSFVRINADERLEELSRRAGLSGCEELALRIAELKRLGGLRDKLEQLEGLDLDKLVSDCLAHPLMKNNPVAMDRDSLRELFENLK